jgi:hypothetical protein
MVVVKTYGMGGTRSTHEEISDLFRDFVGKAEEKFRLKDQGMKERMGKLIAYSLAEWVPALCYRP